MLEAEQILESLLINSPAGIAILEGPDLRYVKINQNLADLNGHPVKFHIGKPLIKVLPDAKENLIPVMRKIMEDGKAVLGREFSITLPKDPDKSISLIDYLFPIHDKHGKPIGIGAIVLDISQRKEAEEGLKLSEQRYRSLYTKTPVMLHSVDADNKLVDVNDHWLKEFGYNRDEVIGKNMLEFLTIESKRYALKVAEPDFWKTGYAYDIDYQFVKKNGEIMDISLSSVAEYDPKGKFKRSIAVLKNITERKRAEEELQRSHETLDSIASIQSKFISESTRSEIFEELLADILKLSKSQFGFIGEVRKRSDGKPYLVLYGVSNIAWDQESRKYYDENYEKGMEFTNLDTLFGEVMKRGKTVISNKPLEDKRSGGTPKGHPPLKSFIGIPLYSEDIMVGMIGLANRQGDYKHEIIDSLEPYIKTTANMMRSYKLYRHRQEVENDLKESQERFRNLSARIQLEREEERTEVAHEIHDELGQALTALKMDISSLLNDLPHNIKRYSKKVKSITDLIDRTSDSVRKISTKLRPGVLDVLGLIPAIEWQSEEFQERTNIRCSVVSKIEEIRLDKDVSTAVFRIFQEALTNVIRHSKATKVKVRLKQDKDKFELIISDNGVGITEEEKNNPASFGLIAMRERLYPWRGDLSIEGTEGKGTTISVKVPN